MLNPQYMVCFQPLKHNRLKRGERSMKNVDYKYREPISNYVGWIWWKIQETIPQPVYMYNCWNRIISSLHNFLLQTINRFLNSMFNVFTFFFFHLSFRSWEIYFLSVPSGRLSSHRCNCHKKKKIENWLIFAHLTKYLYNFCKFWGVKICRPLLENSLPPNFEGATQNSGKS